MIRFIPSLAALLLALGLPFAQDISTGRDSVEIRNPLATKVALNPYSAGLQVGALYALSDSLEAENQTLAKISIIQSFAANDHFNVNLDLDWLLPGTGFGGTVGFDYALLPEGFRPLLGAAIGLHYLDKGGKFGDDFGPTAMGYVGFLLDLADQFQIRVRVPYMAVLNQDADQGVGLDIGFLVSSPQRRTKVQKLRFD